MRVLHQSMTGIERPQQWMRLTRTYRSGGDVGEPDAVVRVSVAIERGGDDQSSYKAEVWTPAGWTEVVRMYPGDPDAIALMELTSSYSGNTRAKRESLDRVAKELLERAMDVLR